MFESHSVKLAVHSFWLQLCAVHVAVVLGEKPTYSALRQTSASTVHC